MNAAVNENPRAAEIARMHERIAAMVPRLEERAPRTRAERRVPDETFAELREAGFFRLFSKVPAQQGTA